MTISKWIFLIGSMSSLFASVESQANVKSCQDVFSSQIGRELLSPPEKRVARAVDRAIELMSRPQTQDVPRSVEISLDVSRKSFFHGLYSTGFVRADAVGATLSDKLVTTRALEHFLGRRFREFSPRAMGLKEFLAREGLLSSSGKVVKSRDEILESLKRVFPDGVILKPTSGKSSDGVGFLASAEQVADAVSGMSGKSVYSPSQYERGTSSGDSRTLSSGEKFILMDRIQGSLLDGDRLQAREYRVHILNGDVVKGATISRWWEWVPTSDLQAVEKKSQQLFNLLPEGMKRGQAFAIDVIYMPNGGVQLIEINTNGGKYGSTWSGFSSLPRVIKAHTDLLQKKYDWRLVGPGAAFYNAGLANARVFLKLEFEELQSFLENGSVNQVQYVGILKNHLDDTVNPALKLLGQIPEVQKTDEMRSTEAFLSSFKSLLEPVERYDDSAWKTFSVWFKSQI